MGKIKTAKQLRDDLLSKYESASTEDQKKDLTTFTQAASAIIRSVKVELDYQKYKGKNEDIEFLENGK